MAETHTTRYGDHAPDWVPIAWSRDTPFRWRCRMCGWVIEYPLAPAPIPWSDPSSTPLADIEAFLRRRWG